MTTQPNPTLPAPSSDAPSARRSLPPGLGVALLLLLFTVLSVALVVSGSRPQTASLPRELIGQPAPETIVATHAFAYARVSDPATNRQREEAALRVLPIWNYDRNQLNEVSGRIRYEFEQMRCALYQAAQNRQGADGDADKPEGSDDAPAAGSGNTESCAQGVEPGVLSNAERRAELCRPPRWEAFLRDIGAPTTLPIDLCEPLADNGFTNHAAFALRSLVESALSTSVVADEVMASEDGMASRVSRRHNAGTGDGHVDEVDPATAFRRLSRARNDIETGPSGALEGLGNRRIEQALRTIGASLVVPNTSFDAAATAEARAAAADAIPTSSVRREFRRGQQIVAEGERVTALHVETVEYMNQSAPRRVQRGWTGLGTALLLVLMLGGLALHSRATRRSWVTKDVAMMGTVLVFNLGLLRFALLMAEFLNDAWDTVTVGVWLAMFPFAAGAMVVRMLTTMRNALAYGIVFTALTAVMLDFSLIWAAFALVSSAVGAAAVRTAHSRGDVYRASVTVGGAMVVLGIAIVVLGQVQLGGGTVVNVLFPLAACVCALSNALVVDMTAHGIEFAFRYTTPFKLLELTNHNHPLLRDLTLKTPGSYHHSMMVAQLVEAACEEVGANALLGRVGAYYHDIGKMKNPLYFAENQHGENLHDKLKPNMSALVIKAHVKDGVEMARKHNLPPEIIDFIKEHHGTSLIRAFYHKAKKDNPDGVREEDYRYPGPRPQSRETAICLLADGIEAAVRAMPEKNEALMRKRVNDMIRDAFTDGQLDECDLTLKDLNAIARAFMKRLNAMYHQRPQYPGGERAATKPGGQRRDSTTGPNATTTGAAPDAPGGEPNPEAPQASEPPTDNPDARPGDSGAGGTAAHPTVDEHPPSDPGASLRRLGLS